MQSYRYNTGWEKLKEIDGEVGEKVVNSLKEISPDLARFVVEYPFGDIYTRDGLDMGLKELAVVAALTAMGTVEPQLKVHVNAALNTGNSIIEVKEAILQMVVYAGFPSCISAMNVLREVINERKARGVEDDKPNPTVRTPDKDLLNTNEDNHPLWDTQQLDELTRSIVGVAPELVSLFKEFAYEKVFSRNVLSRKQKSIIAIAALTALGYTRSTLKLQVKVGLDAGLTAEEVKEIMLLMTVYLGFPSAINGINVLKSVLDERETSSST